MSQHSTKLVALDLDGTCVDGFNAMPPVMEKAIRGLHARGVELAFLTGRRPRTAVPILEELGLPALLATNSGCMTWDFPSMKPLGRNLFPAELLVEAAELLDPHTVGFFVAGEWGDEEHTEVIMLERSPNYKYEELKERFKERTVIIKSPAELNGHPITQLAIPEEDDAVREAAAKLRAAFGARLIALEVHWPLASTMALEVFGPGGHKAAALSQFADRLGIAQHEVLAAGDDVNDLTMLEWAGRSYAMPHARSEVKDAAKTVLSGDDGFTALADVLASVPGTANHNRH